MNYAELFDEYQQLVDAFKEKDYAHAAVLINRLYEEHYVTDFVTESMFK